MTTDPSDLTIGQPSGRAVLDSLGVHPDALLGRGGEASMYALDAERVVRVLHKPCDPAHILERQELVDELVLEGAPFALPEVLGVSEIEGITYAIEQRLSGVSVIDALRSLDGPDRDRLVEAHLDAAAALGDLHLEPRD